MQGSLEDIKSAKRKYSFLLPKPFAYFVFVCLFVLSSHDYVEPVMKDQHQVFHFVFYLSLSQAWRTERPYIYLPRWVSECLSICGFTDKTKCVEMECDRQWGRVEGTETMRYSMRNIQYISMHLCHGCSLCMHLFSYIFKMFHMWSKARHSFQDLLWFSFLMLLLMKTFVFLPLVRQKAAPVISHWEAVRSPCSSISGCASYGIYHSKDKGLFSYKKMFNCVC